MTVTASSHRGSTVHSILKSVFLEIQNKVTRPVLSGPFIFVSHAGACMLHQLHLYYYLDNVSRKLFTTL